MRLLLWLVPTGAAALVVASFVVSNREPVELGLWPLPDAYGIPLFAIVLVAVALGFLAGWSTSWVRHGRIRSERRRHARRVEALEAELATKQAASSKPSESRALVS
ncbi:MAG TPA: LapA family protein [Stellaceae bacterium]|nr:LapA family protein [Stellaceae bacterium]